MKEPKGSFYSRFRAIGLTLIGLVILDLGIRATADFWDRHSPDDYRARVEGCASAPRDLVFVGGSLVSEGIVPSKFSGLDWQGESLHDIYSVGLPGGTTSEIYHAVKYSCTKPPKLLIYGITASDLNDGRHEPHGPASLMTMGDVAEWARTRPDSREWVIRQHLLAKCSQSWALYHHRHGIRMAAARLASNLSLLGDGPSLREANELYGYSTALHNGDGYAPAAGYVKRSYEYSKIHNIPTPPFTFLDRYRTGSHLQYLDKIESWCRLNEVSLVLVDMPVTADVETKYPEAFSQYRKLLQEWSRQHGIVVLYAHRDIVGITDAGFADMVHLNGVGAVILSNWIRSQLEKANPTQQRQFRAQIAEDRP